jgi:holo-[acyl-carrier protein] synthase
MGVDIAEVDRIRAAIERYGETILRRIYTQKERDYCEQFKNKFERYAGRFAAKEER